MVLAALCPLGLPAQGIADVCRKLREAACFRADATFAVTLPQSDADVTYTLKLASAAAADTLAPCSYLTDWSLATPSGGTSEGFSAYFAGHHYRYQSQRLQEYHLEWDSVPFRPNGNVPGVQISAQFADLYPAFIAAELERISTDPRYSVNVSGPRTFDGHTALRIDAVMTISGVTAMERTWILEEPTMLPLRITTESNPGQITEQSVLVSYSYPTPSEPCPEITEAALTAAYPEVFEKYRENNFTIESLAGQPLPTFSLPTTTGERYTYHRGDGFKAPTVVVMMDPTAGFNAEIVGQVRSAIDRLPREAEAIWVFNSTNTDAIEAIVPELRPGEQLLMNGKSLIRDCGVASLPVIVIADSKGEVKKVNLGFNRDLSNIVLQSAALAN